MIRTLTSLVILAALGLLAMGCEPKTTTVERRTTVQESEPQMVSPGQEVVE